MSLMKPRTLGNSSSYAQQVLEENHSQEWARRSMTYLEACKTHKKGCLLTGQQVDYLPPPPYTPVPLAQWFETAHGNEVLVHRDEMKGVITSTFGKILKLDSTKKVRVTLHVTLTYTFSITLWVHAMDM